MDDHLILKYLGKPTSIEDNNIVFEKHRKFENLSIEGVHISGSDVDEAFISFTLADDGSCLIISEIPVLEEEVAVISKYLLDLGGSIGAIHNHWLFITPRVYYLHWQMKSNVNKILLEYLKVLWEQL